MSVPIQREWRQQGKFKIFTGMEKVFRLIRLWKPFTSRTLISIYRHTENEKPVITASRQNNHTSAF